MPFACAWPAGQLVMMVYARYYSSMLCPAWGPGCDQCLLKISTHQRQSSRIVLGLIHELPLLATFLRIKRLLAPASHHRGTVHLGCCLCSGTWRTCSQATRKVHIALRGVYGAYAAIHDLESGAPP